MNRRLSVTLGALLVVCTSCDTPKTEDPAPAAESKPAASPPVTKVDDDEGAQTKRVEIASTEPPKVTVEDAGADPKEALRLTPVAGTEEKVLMTMNMRMTMAMAGQKMPAVTTPPMLIDARGRVDSVSDEGLVVTYIVDGIRVGESKDADPAVVTKMKSMLDGMTSFEAHLEMDRRGALLGGYVDVPQALPAPIQQMVEQMQQSFGQIQVPLPEEPVGVGAKWTAVSNLDQGGMKLEQTATYSVTSREGAQIKIAVVVSQKLIDPNFTPPGMPGMKAKIDVFQSGGKGALTLELDHWSPLSFSTDVTVKMGMQISAMGQEQKQDLEMDMGLTLERK